MSFVSIRSISRTICAAHSDTMALSAQTISHVENAIHFKREISKIILVSGNDHQRMEIRRNILAAMSKYFDRILPNDCENCEIILEGIDGRILSEIVSFLYTEYIELHEDNVKELLQVASKYEFALLREKCIDYGVRRLSVTNCVNWFAIAGTADTHVLRGRAFQMICASFERISARDMCDLNFENFKEIIESDENMAKEEIIFDQLIKWIQFDETGRSQHAHELLQCIRLKHMLDKAMVDKVMVFCQKYNIVGFTDNEYTKRILYPGPLYQSRYAYTRSVYVIHERGSSVVVRVFDGFYKCWRRVMTVTNELPQKYYGIAFAANKLFIIGGRTETGTFLKDVDVFDFASRTCTDLPAMLVARGFFNPLVVDQFIYVFGGYDGVALRNCERFDMRSKKWKRLKSMQYGHHSLTVAAMNGYIYTADGNYQNKGSFCSVNRYDPIKDVWMKVTNVLNPMFEGVLVEWKGFLYAAGVNVGMERYDCERNIWVPVATNDVPLGEDEILTLLYKMKIPNFDYYREQIVVMQKNFFRELCGSNSRQVCLKEFRKNSAANQYVNRVSVIQNGESNQLSSAVLH